MATQFIQSYLDRAQYVLTSSVPRIQARTDRARVNVSLYCEDGLGGDPETFFSCLLYAFDGIVELADVGAIVEEYFRQRDKVADTITIVCDGTCMDVHFLYCECAIQEFSPQRSFFIAAAAQRVHQDSTITIATVPNGSIPFIIKAVGHTDTGNHIASVQKKVQKSFDRDGVTYFSVPEILQWALETDPALRDVLYFSIEYADIQKMCYIVPAPAYLTFSFRNIFNVQEFLDVVGVMTTKTAVSRDIAVSSGVSKQYNRSVERTYEIQTEALTAEEVHVFEQFLASHRVQLWLDGDEWDVLITDHTCEADTDDESLTTIKFTWQFADRRPRIFASLMDGIMPSRRRIFDDTFTPEYE